MKKTIFIWVAFMFILFDANAEEVTYRKQIQPLFDSKCIVCHGSEAAPEYDAFKSEKDKWLAKGQGMRMDTYSHLIFYTAWPDGGARYPESCTDCERQKNRFSVGYTMLKPSPPYKV